MLFKFTCVSVCFCLLFAFVAFLIFLRVFHVLYVCVYVVLFRNLSLLFTFLIVFEFMFLCCLNVY